MTTYKDIYNSENDPMYEMANIYPNSSGLKFKIYISKEPSVEHNVPRAKVNLDGNNWYPISIHDTNPRWLTNTPKIKSKVFHNIQKFITINHGILIQLWNEEIDAIEFAKKMTRV